MKRIKILYESAKSAKVGDVCVCPSCGTEFKKTSYQQAFCKSKPGTVCKDKYWNTVTPGKRNNTTRISPASARWLSAKDIPIVVGFGDSQRELDRIDRLSRELEDDGSWDSHQCYVERCEWCGCIDCRCDDFGPSSFDI